MLNMKLSVDTVLHCSCGALLSKEWSSRHECLSVGDRVITTQSCWVQPALTSSEATILVADRTIPAGEKGVVEDVWSSFMVISAYVNFDRIPAAWVYATYDVHKIDVLDRIAEATESRKIDLDE